MGRAEWWWPAGVRRLPEAALRLDGKFQACLRLYEGELMGHYGLRGEGDKRRGRELGVKLVAATLDVRRRGQAKCSGATAPEGSH